VPGQGTSPASQADSAGSIPVTRSTTKYQVSGSRWSLVSSPLVRRRRPRAIDVSLAHGHGEAGGEARAGLIFKGVMPIFKG